MKDKLDKKNLKKEKDSCEGVEPWVQKIKDGNTVWFRIESLENTWFGIRPKDEVHEGKKVWEYIGIKHF